MLFDIKNCFVKYYLHLGLIQHLFFANQLSKQILKINWDIIFLNYIYKKNHYYMPLYVITKVTGLNTSFYIGFAFISSKIYTDYY